MTGAASDVAAGPTGPGHSRLRRDLALVGLLVLGPLVAWLDKAYTIDDALFLKLARHLQQEPFDFYGFDVNWYGTYEPMHGVTMNPPATGYVIAAVAGLFSWDERVQHGAFLLAAAAVCLGTYLLARRLTGRPLEATLLGLLTPVFLVSSTNVMCDTSMLALWCWAVYAWMRGFDGGGRPWLWVAALLVALAGLTKYYGVALLPLLFLYGWMKSRRPGAWTLCLVLPLAVFVAYQLLTTELYGRGLLGSAARYAVAPEGLRKDWNLPNRVLVGLSFAGGCILPALFLAPLLWTRRALLAGLLCLALGLFWLDEPVQEAIFLDPLWKYFPEDGPPPLVNHTVVAQLCLFALGGVSLLALCAAELRARRDPEAWLLVSWLLGTFAFAAFLNWVNNGRSNLPMAPVAGILIVRQLERRAARGAGASLGRRLGWAAPAFLLALLVAHADYVWAGENRAAARELVQRARRIQPDPLVFQGHWGFQHYMEEGGAVPLDYDEVLPAGTLLVVPTNNAQTVEPEAWIEAARGARSRESSPLVFERRNERPRWIHTVAHGIGAGFYASNIGPLPWVIARPWPPDLYRVWRAPSDHRFSSRGRFDG